MQAFVLIFIALLGACVGSFLNVLIFRIPQREEYIRTPSHCMACGHRLKWFEMVPVVSWLLQRGQCRSCGTRISLQYPIVEAANALAWLLSALFYWQEPLRLVLYCTLFSILLVIAVIDWRTFEIPAGLNLTIGILGVIQLAADMENWRVYLIGMFSVSLVFLLLWFFTGGAGLGLGDVKLVAAAGLLLGWLRMIPAILVASISGVVLHGLRMRRGAGRKLAFGPYLALGIWLSALFGNRLIHAYLGLFGL